MPYPNELRMDAANGRIDLADFPGQEHNALAGEIVRLSQDQRTGFPVVPIVWFAFDGPIGPERVPSSDEAVPVKPWQVLFLNIDPQSPSYGKSYPALADWFPGAGAYVTAYLLTASPFPGVVLEPATRYAAVVRTTLGDAWGRPLAQNIRFRAALSGAGGDATAETLRDLYAPLREYLAKPGDISTGTIAAATVFRTGDPSGAMDELVDRVTQKYGASVAEPFVNVHTDDTYCFLRGRLRFPQFQQGKPPYAETGSGDFVWGSDGLPQLQRYEDVPVTLTFPRSPIPVAPAAEGGGITGYPYLEYVHGSGGVATEFVDRGPVTVRDGGETPWRGPAWVAAGAGYAAGSQAMPISPDRIPGVLTSFDYLQFSNLQSLRGNFRQGVIELTLKRRWLRSARFDAALCPGATSPDGKLRIDPARFAVQGQSMGAMYTNMYGSLATDATLLVPTGSGGYWSYFVFTTALVPETASLLQIIAGLSADERASHLHPLLGLFQQYVEAVDPMVFMPHIVRRPLPGRQPKHLYVPHGRNDLYFSRQTQRAVGLAYGVARAPSLGEDLSAIGGAEIDPGFDAPLAALADVTAASTYPLQGNDTQGVTASQVLFLEEPIQKNGHTVMAQRDGPKRQLVCLLRSLHAPDDMTAPTLDVPDTPSQGIFSPCP